MRPGRRRDTSPRVVVRDMRSDSPAQGAGATRASIGADISRIASLVLRLVALSVLALAVALPASGKEPILLADPAAPLDEAWTHQRFSAATEYDRVTLEGVAAIRAI